MPHRIHVHRVVLLAVPMTQPENILELVHRVPHQKVQTQIKLAQAHIVAKDKFVIRQRQLQITIAMDNRI